MKPEQNGEDEWKCLPCNSNFSFSGHCHRYKAEKTEGSKPHLLSLTLFDTQLSGTLSKNNTPSAESGEAVSRISIAKRRIITMPTRFNEGNSTITYTNYLCLCLWQLLRHSVSFLFLTSFYIVQTIISLLINPYNLFLFLLKRQKFKKSCDFIIYFSVYHASP